MNFQIQGLPRARFAPLFGLSDPDLAARGVVRVVAEKGPTTRFPCRVSLRDAESGESVLLLGYEHLAVDSPYRSRYAIYVRENADEAKLVAGEIPEVLQNRPLSLRAFDEAGMLVDAGLGQAASLVPTVQRLLGNPCAAYLHVHNAMHGCFVARVDRV